MKSPTLRLGALPPIQVSPGTLVTVAVFALMLYPSFSDGSGSFSAAALLPALGIALFLVLSVLVHEVGHAVSARAFGATVDHIALTLWGGHTQYTGRPMSAAASIVISLSGPVSNLALAALATAAGTLTDAGTTADVFWYLCSRLNLALALFNLLPGLPMDGGRALESLLGGVLRNPLLGTRVTAWIGRGIAVLVVLVPLRWILQSEGAGTFLLLALLWAMLIAGMLWQGASRALGAATLQARIDTLAARSLARPLRLVAPQQMLSDLGPSSELDALLVLDQRTARPGVVGHVLRVQPAAAAAVPDGERSRTPISAVAGPVGEMGALRASLRGDELVSAILARPFPLYLVLEDSGQALGVILSDEVNALLRGR
ncbi:MULTISPECIES: site-2 protease family protein [Brachybacterium]|uniref:site-2 protease family protein n=1 Tax=Brachybacterium TaxID=43668 RepID=UPI001865CD79|nr:site-2 protease family protein [Brachybacterium tyrofermentans]